MYSVATHNLNYFIMFFTGTLKGFPSGCHIIKQIFNLKKNTKVIVQSYIKMKFTTFINSQIALLITTTLPPKGICPISLVET